MRFVAYSLLGVMAGGIFGAFGGYFGSLVFQTVTNEPCLDDECAIASIALGLFLMIAGAALGALLGLWTAWLQHRRR
ncbi:hypothetical protein ACETIH_05215 [Microvirga arabica]|uniref:Major facilitator superfamily (MFS) profile domain-containing protein n=1 Tax=Microvirga arabica TaxID=1128671 RepID=A0ABV6Y4D7_9HYPH